MTDTQRKLWQLCTYFHVHVKEGSLFFIVRMMDSFGWIVVKLNPNSEVNWTGMTTSIIHSQRSDTNNNWTPFIIEEQPVVSFQFLSEPDERKESTREISFIYFKQTFRSSHISWRFLLTLRRVIKETLISHHSSRQTRESLIGYHIEREKIFLSSNISSQTKLYTYNSNIHNADWICMSIFLL